MGKLLTKSKYLAGLQCSKLLWMMIHKKNQIPQASEDAIARMDAGTKIGILATKLFPNGIDISTEDFIGNINKQKSY
jgi:hypothetical protein